jgi:hypothetical protein
MNRHLSKSSLFIALLIAAPAFAQKTSSLADNAALRYWSAFSVIQDSALTEQDAKQLTAVLDGAASYDDAKYKALLDKNKLPLDLLARATAIPHCDWGLDYQAEDVPVEYARKALVLGRLNVLYALHQSSAADKQGSARTLIAGLHFSHDVAKGGSFFAAAIAQTLLQENLTAIDNLARANQLSATDKSEILKTLANLSPIIDWPARAQLELDSLRRSYAKDATSSAALDRIIGAYLTALIFPDKLPAAIAAIQNAPPQLANVIPNPSKVIAQQQDLTKRLAATRALLAATP